jgi:hypothetical protein
MSSLTVYTGLPGITVSDAPPKALAALRWAQEHHLGNRDWIAAASTATNAGVARAVLGEVLRIRASVTDSKDAGASAEWVGRLTGDRQKPILTMRWDHDVPSISSACNSAGTS